jgi:hypothetical protein
MSNAMNLGVDISGDLMNINTMDYPVALICQEKVFNKI